MVIKSKYIINSRALFTGCLNLTIDNAPIIPKERAIFPYIVLVIMHVIIGKIKKDMVWEYDLAHICPADIRDNLMKYPPNNITINGKISDIFFSLDC